MSEPNIIHVQSFYAAFGRGDLEFIIRACALDVTWELVGRPTDFPHFGVHQGAAGVTHFFQALLGAMAITEFTPKSFHASGDKVFVEGHERATVHATGREVDSDWLHIFTFKDGTLTGFREFNDTAQYVEAARA